MVAYRARRNQHFLFFKDDSLVQNVHLTFFKGHVSFFGATGTPVLDFWRRHLWVSKPKWVLPYLLFCRGKCYVHSQRFTSGATRSDLLEASIAASPVTSRGEVAGMYTLLSNNGSIIYQRQAPRTADTHPRFSYCKRAFGQENIFLN